MEDGKPEWLPDKLWPALQRYRDEFRKADPTEGFARTMASYHPSFDGKAWALSSKTVRWTYCKTLLGIGTKRRADVDDSKMEDR